MNTCQSCRAWRSHDGVSGRCVRHAPRPTLDLTAGLSSEDALAVVVWGVTLAEDGCDEHVPHPVVQLPPTPKRANALCESCRTWGCNSEQALHMFQTGHHPLCGIFLSEKRGKESTPATPAAAVPRSGAPGPGGVAAGGDPA